MKLRYDVVSHVGNVRTNNEDMALVLGEQIRDSSVSFTLDVPKDFPFTAIVADGMGGYDKGEVASYEATASFDEFLKKLPPQLDGNEVIIKTKEWVKNINGKILEMAAGSGMGCTFCGIFTYEGLVFTINIGDSRLYRLRYDHFKQMTTDHSERNRTGDPNVASNIIYNALGVHEAFADISLIKLIKGDKYLICSDGLNDMVSDEEIETLMISNDASARQLLESALSAGGKDNVTIILLEIIEDNV